MYTNNYNKISKFISKICCCDITYLDLKNQILLLDEFIFLAASVSKCYFQNVKIVKNQNGEELFLEEIIENLPKLPYFMS